MGSHALLSPSGAHRWMNCPPSLRLEESIVDEGSDYAREGTLAHAYCARKLRELLGWKSGEEEQDIAELEDTYHTPEMDEHVDYYVSLVMEKYNAARKTVRDAQILVETRLDFGMFLRDAFGTADAIIMTDGTMEIIDFKYGKGVKVESDHNPQMMIYALGAYEKFSFEYNIRSVRMTIVQPRLDHVSEFEMPMTDLLKWRDEELIPAAKKAYAGEGEQTPGDWCKFCKVKRSCRALALKAKEAACLKDKGLLKDSELSEYLPLIPVLKSWLADFEGYAIQRALSGADIPGWKVVEGRSIRAYKDPEQVMQAMQVYGYNPEEYLKPREPKGITDMEKLLGKGKFKELLGSFVVKPQGKPTLAPMTDKRPAYNQAALDFGEINLNDN